MRRLPVTNRVVPVALVVLLGGCAQRGLAADPQPSPPTSSWFLAASAAGLAAVVLASIVVLPARRPGGARLASWVLGLQAGGVVVAAAIVAGAAVRSGQLLRPGAEHAAGGLLSLGGLDGHAAEGSGLDLGRAHLEFFDLVAVVTLLLGGLLAVTFALGARCAADRDPLERQMAAGLLGAEVVASCTCLILVVIGFRHAGFVLPALALPVLVAATRSAWLEPTALERAHG